MITNAEKSMLPQLIKLWEECFGDQEEYSRFFFENHLHGTEIFDNLYVFVENGIPVSMLTVLNAVFVSDREKIVEKKDFWYIYGVATATKHRGKGYAGRLLRHVLDLASKDGAVAGLVPAERSLFAYYKRFGFEKGFYKTVWEFPISSEEKMEARIDYVLEPIDEKRYNQLRNDAFHDVTRIEWSDYAVHYAIEENRLLGGETCKVTVEGDSYFIMYYVYDGVLFIRETNMPSSLIKVFAYNLCADNKIDKVRVSYFASESKVGEKVEHAMVYGKEIIGEDAYFGLALD